MSKMWDIADQSLARAISIFRVGEVDLVDTAQKLGVVPSVVQKNISHPEGEITVRHHLTICPLCPTKHPCASMCSVKMSSHYIWDDTARASALCSRLALQYIETCTLIYTTKLELKK